MREKCILSYFHDNNEGHFGCQDVPELHGVSVLVLVAWRVPVVTVSVQTNKRAASYAKISRVYREWSENEEISSVSHLGGKLTQITTRYTTNACRRTL